MMKNVIAFVVFGSLFSLNFSPTPKRIEHVTSWLSVEYINCMNKSLPCDCEKKVNKFISINTDTTLNSSQQRISLFRHGRVEPFFYKLNRSGKNRFEILDGSKNSPKLGIITFKHGSLYLHDKYGDTRYVSIGKSEDLYNDNYALENVALINKVLELNRYPVLDKILIQDSLRCDCNKEANLVYLKGKPRAWVLEQSKDSLCLFKIINEDSGPDEAIIKKKIFQFKRN